MIALQDQNTTEAGETANEEEVDEDAILAAVKCENDGQEMQLKLDCKDEFEYEDEIKKEFEKDGKEFEKVGQEIDDENESMVLPQHGQLALQDLTGTSY